MHNTYGAISIKTMQYYVTAGYVYVPEPVGHMFVSSTNEQQYDWFDIPYICNTLNQPRLPANSGCEI